MQHYTKLLERAVDAIAATFQRRMAIEDEDDLDSLLLVHDQRFLRLLEEARQRVRVAGCVSLAEMRQQVG
ncbi:MAG: hypothetical protein KJZ95_22130 [Caldilinea sp.]|nr:hypothetical protein [Caldilinea sp.]